MTEGDSGAVDGFQVRWNAHTGEVWVNVAGVFSTLWIKVGSDARSPAAARAAAENYLARRGLKSNGG